MRRRAIRQKSGVSRYLPSGGAGRDFKFFEKVELFRAVGAFWGGRFWGGGAGDGKKCETADSYASLLTIL